MALTATSSDSSGMKTMAIKIVANSPVEQHQRYEDSLQVAERTGPITRTGFFANEAAAFSQGQRELKSTAHYDAEAPIRERNEYIDQLIADNDIDIEPYLHQPQGLAPPEEGPATEADWAVSVANAYLNPLGTDFAFDTRELDYDALGDYLSDQGYEVSKRADLDAKISADLAEAAQQDAEIFSRANMAGKAGIVAGSLRSGIWDPLNLPLMLLPGAQARIGATLAANVGKGAAIGAAQTAGVEALYNQGHKEFRRKYNLAERDLLEDAAMGAAVGLVTGGLGGAVGHALTRRRLSTEPEYRVNLEKDDIEPPKVDLTKHPAGAEGVPTSQQLDRTGAEFDANAATIQRIDPELHNEVVQARDWLNKLQAFQACLFGGVN